MNLHCICYLKWRESILKIEEKKIEITQTEKKPAKAKKNLRRMEIEKKYGQKWV